MQKLFYFPILFSVSLVAFGALSETLEIEKQLEELDVTECGLDKDTLRRLTLMPALKRLVQ